MPFTKGDPNINRKGRPPGVSFTTAIKDYLKENPEKFKEIMDYYIDNKKMRDLLWKMIDGQPKQNVEMGLDDSISEIDIKIRKNENKD